MTFSISVQYRLPSILVWSARIWSFRDGRTNNSNHELLLRTHFVSGTIHGVLCLIFTTTTKVRNYYCYNFTQKEMDTNKEIEVKVICPKLHSHWGESRVQLKEFSNKTRHWDYSFTSSEEKQWDVCGRISLPFLSLFKLSWFRWSLSEQCREINYLV